MDRSGFVEPLYTKSPSGHLALLVLSSYCCMELKNVLTINNYYFYCIYERVDSSGATGEVLGVPLACLFVVMIN